MQQGYTIGEASRYLNVDPKTVQRWCRLLGIEPDMISCAGRVKLYSREQLDSIAQVLQRSAVIKAEPAKESPAKPTVDEKQIDPLVALQKHLERLEQTTQAVRETFEQLLLARRS